MAFKFTPPRGGWSVGHIRQMLATHQLFVPTRLTWPAVDQ